MVCQIDESVVCKQKYYLGAPHAGTQLWVFGIFDCKSRKGYIELVQDRSADSLIPIIQRICEPGVSLLHFLTC